MNLALNYGANHIWIVNVGDLKPMEFPIELFLSLARNPERWGKDNLQEFIEPWASREFGPERAAEIADIVTKYTQFHGRRKPEQLEPDTFSLVNYREADRVDSDWKSLVERAEKVNQQLPENKHDAFFELVLHPVKASAIVNELYITVGKNHLYATQGRVSTNDFARDAEKLFAADAELSAEYNHKLANGKWNHMMDQTHLGYTFWNDPPLNAMPAITRVQPDSGPSMAVAVEGLQFATSRDFERFALPAFDSFNRQTRYIDVFNRGAEPFEFSASADRPWIKLSNAKGTISKEERIQVSIDWHTVPEGANAAAVTITQKNGIVVHVRVEAINPSALQRESLKGFVEANHYVSIEAEHFTNQTAADDVHWDKIPGFGETLSGMTIFSVTSPSAEPPQPAPVLEYNMYLFESGQFNVQAILAPTLKFVPGRGLRYAISFDDQPLQVINSLENNSDKDWKQAVSDGVRKVSTMLNVESPGYHTLKFRMVDAGVVLEKLVVSAGHLPPSYLGPPESYRQSRRAKHHGFFRPAICATSPSAFHPACD